MLTLDEFIDKIRSTDDNEDQYDYYQDNVQQVVEFEIKKAGKVKDEYIKEIAEAEIRRAWEDGHSYGVSEVVNYLLDCTLIN